MHLGNEKNMCTVTYIFPERGGPYRPKVLTLSTDSYAGLHMDIINWTGWYIKFDIIGTFESKRHKKQAIC